MIKTIMISLLVARTALSFAAPTDSTGLPGDHFSLEAALSAFKDAKTLEEFERRINSKGFAANNLDLNQDGQVDYLTVRSDGNGDHRIVVVTALISKTERQDVAIIEIDRKGKEQALLQIVGDADLYGEEVYVEPYEESIYEKEDKGPAMSESSGTDIWINVWFWPCVQYCYGPVYVVYVSPWYWGFYPDWWSPWPPFAWVYYYPLCVPHHHYYHHVHMHRTAHIHQTVYIPRRTHSKQVRAIFDKPIRTYRDRTEYKPKEPKRTLESKPRERQDRDEHPRNENRPPQREDSKPRAQPRKNR